MTPVLKDKGNHVITIGKCQNTLVDYEHTIVYSVEKYKKYQSNYKLS